MRVTKAPEIRREEILDAALHLFRQDGYEKVSVESIARAAQIAKGSFYNYFKTKEDVYEAVLSDMAAQSLGRIKDIVCDKAVEPKERVVKYINWTFDLSRQNANSLSRVLSTKGASGHKQMYLQVLDEGIKQMLPAFVDLLSDGAKSNEFDIKDPAFSATAMLGALRELHISFYQNMMGDIEAGRNAVFDLLSRILGTKF